MDNLEFRRTVYILFAVWWVILFLISLKVDAAEADREQIDSYIEEIAEQYGICPELVQAIVEAESSYRPDAQNGDCKGLMQVSEKWHTDRMDKLGVTDLYDPYGNILVGVDYLAELAEKYEDVGLVLMMYNMRHDTAMKYYKQGKLSKYAEKVLERSAELEREHGK